MKGLLSVISLGTLLFVLSCAGGGGVDTQSQQDQLNSLNSQVQGLVSMEGQLNGLAQSEYADCTDTGDLTNPLVQKICVIAQGATAELQTQLLAQLGTMSENLESQIEQVQTDLSNEAVALSTRIDTVSSEIATINSSLTEFNCTDDKYAKCHQCNKFLQRFNRSPRFNEYDPGWWTKYNIGTCI